MEKLLLMLTMGFFMGLFMLMFFLLAMSKKQKRMYLAKGLTLELVFLLAPFSISMISPTELGITISLMLGIGLSTASLVARRYYAWFPIKDAWKPKIVAQTHRSKYYLWKMKMFDRTEYHKRQFYIDSNVFYPF